MAWLRAYQWECETWPEYRSVYLDFDDAQKLMRDFAAHFNVAVPNLNKGARYGHASFHRKDRTIRMCKVAALGLLCHELAHHLDYGDSTKPVRKRHHDDIFEMHLQRVYEWAKKNLPRRADIYERNKKQEKLYWEAWDEACKHYKFVIERNNDLCEMRDRSDSSRKFPKRKELCDERRA